MKKIITLILIIQSAIFNIQSSMAQAPLKFSYQAIIRNSLNALVKNKIVGMRISILGPANNVVYQEKQKPMTNINGLISIEVGVGTIVSGSIATIDWANGPYFIKTETDPAGGTAYCITGTSQLLSVPYALYAENCKPGPPGPPGPQGPKGAAGGNVVYYPTVSICCQHWMTKNLDVVTYRNGDTIPQVTNDADWASLTTGAYCYYNNDSATYAAVYGKLYNWYAVNDPRGLAPEGWHIATDFEWTTLENCLGGAAIAGGPLKEAGTAHWSAPNTDATNSTGFAGLPGGNRDNSSTFNAIGASGYWWSSTEPNNSDAWFRYLNYFNANIFRLYFSKQFGFSVRCLRD